MTLPRRIATAGSALLAAAALVVASPAPALALPTDAELALRWAPIHYQDSDSSDYDADFLSPIDFDGDWSTINNWEAQDDAPARLTGRAYYSVVETSSHWFLLYGYYHPRDWEDFPDPLGLFTHENDMEGALLTVRKDGSTFGALEAMVTVAHSDFYSYVPPGSPFTNGRETIDGTLVMQNVDGVPHPTTFQEAKAHGLFRWNGANFPGNDGVIYLPTAGAAEAPSSGNDRSVAYGLTDLFTGDGLWARRSDPATFAGPGTFRGDNGADNAANAPWGWDDQNDGQDLTRGLLATDPARLVAAYYGNEGTFSLTYTRNGYLG